MHPGYSWSGVAGYTQGEVAVVNDAPSEGGQKDVVLSLDHVVQSAPYGLQGVHRQRCRQLPEEGKG